MTPEVFSAWVPIIRDIVIVVVASFILIYEVVFKQEPNPYAIGAGLTLLGVPPALRLDRRRKSNGDDDPYEGPGGYYRGG